MRRVLLGVLLLPAGLQAQAPTCRVALDSLDSKVRQNYAGYVLEVKDARGEAYRTMLRGIESSSKRIGFEDCYPLLATYINWFADPHLFVFQSQQVDSATAARRSTGVRRISLTEEAARKQLSVRIGALDPIEGIWYDGPLRIAIIPDNRDPLHRVFIGVVVASDTSAWPVGSVRATFFRQDDGSYGARLSTRDFAQLQLTSRVHKRVLLRFSPGTWGKAWPVAPADTGLLDPVDPRRPRASLRTRSVLISIPSHDPAYVRVVDSLVKSILPAIRDRGCLLIDLRGNEGGSSFTTRALNPIIASTDTRTTPFDSGQAVMLSSASQIAYAKRFTGTDTSAFVRHLVARMEANPGKLVVMDPDEAPSTPDPVTEGGWKVGVLVDGGTVSASEVTVLRALRSRRATVFGEPTAGALDYQSVNIVGLGIADQRWALGYPTITAHTDLPKRGMRGRGMAPDVAMLWTGRGDPVRDVEEWLEFAQPFQVINLMPIYWAFRDSTAGAPIAAQVRAFRSMVLAPEQRFFEQVTGIPDDAGLGRYLENVRPLDSTMRRVSAEMLWAIPTGWRRLATLFPDLRPGVRIYVVPSLFNSNGQVRYVDDSMVVMLGPDVQTYVEVAIDSGRPTPPELNIEHELTHYHHWKVNPEIAKAAKSFFRAGAYSDLYYNLWSEGFATYVTRTLNPDVPLAKVLGPGLDPSSGSELLPGLAQEFLKRFESTEESDVRDLFYLSGRRKDIPLRSAYYVGYQVARFLARRYPAPELARLDGEPLRTGMREALGAMAEGRWTAVP